MIEAAAMEDHQQPPGEAAMAEDRQKPAEAAAMVEAQQKPLVEAAASARYPTEEVYEVANFVSEIMASLEADTVVRDGIVDLIAGFGKDDGGDARAVESRVAELLAGHPDVLRKFTAFVHRTTKAAPAVPAGPLAVTRPRRSSTHRNGRGFQPLPAVKEEPDEQDYESPRKSEAGGAGGHGGRERDDPRVVEAEAFLKRVLEIAGREVSDKLLAVLKLHAGDPFADVIYDGAKDALGPEHAALLGEFASTFLPGQKEWEEQLRRDARREAQRNRRRAAAAARRAAAADDQGPPRADDDYDLNNLHATLEVVKKRLAADGDHRGGHDVDNYAPPFRSKKPRTNGGGGGGGHHRHRNGNGEPSCSGEASRLPNGDVHGYVDKKPRRRLPNGGQGSSAAAAALPPGTEPSNGDAMFRLHRGLWVFYTRYSTLVETMARVEELLHGDGRGGGGFPTSIQELFPRREHRELLGSYYGDHWGEMRAALEDGESTVPALEVVLRRLKVREEEAVAAEARKRRKDADRTAERLAGLVADKVRRKERRRRRQDATDGRASSRQHTVSRR